MGNKTSTIVSKPTTPTNASCPSNQQIISDMSHFGLDMSWLQNFWKWKYTGNWGTSGQVPGQPQIDYDKMMAEMQRLEEINVYQNAYNEAEDNVINGPQKLGEAAYNLYDFRDGEQGYDTFLQSFFTERVDEMKKILKAKFAKEIEDANYLNNIYETAWKNSRNAVDLFKEYKKENRLLEKEIDDDHTIITKNNRKSFYEDDKLIRMNSWNKNISRVYYILLILYIIAISLFSSHSLKIKILLIGFFLLLPYFLQAVYIPLFLSFLSMLYNIYDYFIPHDVYTGEIMNS
jgi:hypothetical protein